MKSIFTNKNSKLHFGWKIAVTFSSFLAVTTIISMIVMISIAINMISTKKIAPSD